MSNLQETVKVWSDFLAAVSDWESLVSAVKPKTVGCGEVYELVNPIDRPNESFAVADMRSLEIAQYHKHINGEVEIYFVLQGTGKIAVGDEIFNLDPGVNIVVPPDTVHITRPIDNLVLAVVNTPAFKSENYVVVAKYEPGVAKMIMKLEEN